MRPETLRILPSIHVSLGHSVPQHHLPRSRATTPGTKNGSFLVMARHKPSCGWHSLVGVRNRKGFWFWRSSASARLQRFSLVMIGKVGRKHYADTGAGRTDEGVPTEASALSLV